ncbi:MAG TPA: hypothetical protein VH835_07080 [Dongiaceae bacterium]|jgi:hypothetical protein
MKDVLAFAALAVFLGLNLWLWIADMSLEARFLRSLLLGTAGFGGFFGYLAYRNRDTGATSSRS